jgi:hypothetical protein
MSRHSTEAAPFRAEITEEAANAAARMVSSSSSSPAPSAELALLQIWISNRYPSGFVLELTRGGQATDLIGLAYRGKSPDGTVFELSAKKAVTGWVHAAYREGLRVGREEASAPAGRSPASAAGPSLGSWLRAFCPSPSFFRWFFLGLVLSTLAWRLLGLRFPLPLRLLTGFFLPLDRAGALRTFGGPTARRRPLPP